MPKMKFLTPPRYIRMFAVTFFIKFCLIAPVMADELQDVKLLLREGNLTEALVRANKALVKKDNDPSMQLVKGLILSEQKKTVEAIEVFTRLTSEHPDYPEPYNNLAVLFATIGQYTKARISLETALKLNPGYATAQENLGDVYLQSAIQIYSEAAKLDSDNANLKAKLKGVKLTLGLPTPDIPVGSTPKKLSPKRQEEVASAATPTIIRSTPKDPPAERDEILRVVDQWSRAWSSKDTKTYFSLYAADFRTPHGENRKKWESGRRSRIVGKYEIDIQVLAPSVTVENNIAVVTFQQVYVSGKLSSNDRKSLTMRRVNGNWKIYQEKANV